MIEKLFKEQRKYIDYFFDHLKFEMVEKLLQIIANSKGTIFFTGVGKSGIIAQKIASTLVSTGSKALYIPPVDALHGDIGIINKDDIFIVLSKSGESEELLQLIPFVKSKGVYLVAVVCNERARLAKVCDHVIVLPLERELCPFDLAPTTSTAIQLIFGDVLAVALMHQNEFTLGDYALNHPFGRIGKRITLFVHDLMLKNEALPLCKLNDKLVDVLVELSNKQCGCLLVVDDKNSLLGIFTDGDLRRSLQNKGASVLEEKVGSLMTKNPKWIESDKLAWEAIKMMEADSEHPVTVLPVLEGTKVVGIIKMHDLVREGL